jgi:ring-1,2-phenylacetyl-CoA epoxidase subunit PaaD
MPVTPVPTAVQLTRAAVETRLAAVPDPELPVVSIVELGMVHEVVVDDERITVTLLPTFIGCPAIDLIREAVDDALADLRRPVTVETSFVVPWTSDRISPTGLANLAAAGIAPPADPADVRCPYCASARVVMDNSFGPTPCRSLFYCRDCRQPFEALKRL